MHACIYFLTYTHTDTHIHTYIHTAAPAAPGQSRLLSLARFSSTRSVSHIPAVGVVAAHHWRHKFARTSLFIPSFFLSLSFSSSLSLTLTLPLSLVRSLSRTRARILSFTQPPTRTHILESAGGFGGAAVGCGVARAPTVSGVAFGATPAASAGFGQAAAGSFGVPTAGAFGAPAASARAFGGGHPTGGGFGAPTATGVFGGATRAVFDGGAFGAPKLTFCAIAALAFGSVTTGGAFSVSDSSGFGAPAATAAFRAPAAADGFIAPASSGAFGASANGGACGTQTQLCSRGEGCLCSK